MKPNIILISCILLSLMLFNSCATFKYSQNDIIGVYRKVQKDTILSNLYLTFTKKNFTLIDEADASKWHGPPKPCCDTVAFGVWSIDNKHGVLSLSTPNLSDTFVDRIVTEKAVFSKDSIYFFINNPIEQKMGKIHQDIFYTLEMTSTNEDLAMSLYQKEFDTNKITIYNPSHLGISDFLINIYTKPGFYARHITVDPVKTYDYAVKSVHGSNCFVIDIPQLTHGYFTYLRLKDHLLKIVDKNKIIWDGDVYERK